MGNETTLMIKLMKIFLDCGEMIVRGRGESDFQTAPPARFTLHVSRFTAFRIVGKGEEKKMLCPKKRMFPQ